MTLETSDRYRIGYACITLGEHDIAYRTCRQTNATPDLLKQIIAHNLDALGRAIDYNQRNGIRLFRISSDLIPFGSSPVNQLVWWDLFAPQLAQIGKKIQQAGMRVSMHPGQYTVLNSTSESVVQNAIDDLVYHNRFLDSLGVGSANKIILHVGGVYGDKPQAIERFKSIWYSLDTSIQRRLVLENDDKSYTISDVLELGNALGIPVVYDNLHNRLKPSDASKSDDFWINLCRPLWHDRDGRQKIHYSQQNPAKSNGSHSESIQIDEFLAFVDDLTVPDLDIMLEVKNKNLSARKCVLAVTEKPVMRELEVEWSRYKYTVLEHNPDDYAKIRQLLNDKKSSPVLEFYHLLEHALAQPITVGHAENAAMHVWGYFKYKVDEKEKVQVMAAIDRLRHADGQEQVIKSLQSYKNLLWKLTLKYNDRYLAESLYFSL